MTENEDTTENENQKKTRLDENQKKIREYLREKYNNDSIEWPSGIKVKLEPKKKDFDTVTLILGKKAIGAADKDNKNMQDNAACFEGWAVALRAAKNNMKIILKVESGLHDFKIEEDGTINENGHYGRFLYRALRFWEQYGGKGGWFELDSTLEGVVNAFSAFLNDNTLKNNVPDNIAGKNGKIECYIEALMAVKEKNAFLRSLENAGCHVEKDKKVYRQLPVGLFLNEVKEGNQVFTGGASAIDLWTMNDNVLQVVELKANNKMVGIITEIFFYSNYMYDLLINKKDKDENVFLLTPPNPKFVDKDPEKNRGYDILYNNAKKIEKIEGIMLADIYHPLITPDVYHPLVTPDVLGVLNAGSKYDEIKYFKAEYDFDVTIKQKQTDTMTSSLF